VSEAVLILYILQILALIVLGSVVEWLVMVVRFGDSVWSPGRSTIILMLARKM